MRLTLRHITRYDYGAPATSAIQSLRLTPRSHDGQWVRRWRIEVSADARLEYREDGYGNIVHTVFVDGPLDELVIAAEGDVDTEDRGGITMGTLERHSPALYLRTTGLTTATPEIARFAQNELIRQGGDKLATLHAMMAALHSDMRFDTVATGTGTTAGESFTARAGVCQDFTHIFCAAARRIGVPARYIAGHFFRTDLIEQEAGHAWAEAYLDGVGWIGFDPTHGVCVTDQHVRVAVGCDSYEAAPVRGTRTGGTGETLVVAVHVSERRGRAAA
ncbi:MAG: transglutaminase family protein [Hyphomicrobiaceae bacterium]|nr:transglutaminase family protein [Hyphomicrobiaceae bacterium]